MKPKDDFKENTNQFKGFEKIVHNWKFKYEMAFILPEFQDLFLSIRQQTAQEIFKEIDDILIIKYKNTFYDYLEFKKKHYEEIKQKYKVN